MTLTITIIAYIASVFLNRWLNKILYLKYGSSIISWFWFIPIMGTLVLLTGFVIEESLKYDFYKRFTGKYWKIK